MTQKIKLLASSLTKVPEPYAPDEQLALITVNGFTAYFLLRDYMKLNQGDWIIQNAANSNVGRYLIALAKEEGIKTLNIVRRESLFSELYELGATEVILDSQHEEEKMISNILSKNIKLGIDAVAGDATQRLADCLEENGTIANYGLLSGEPCSLSPNDIIFRNISLTGVWLTMWLRGRGSTQEQRQSVYEELREYIIDGRMHAQVEATYNLDQIKDAVKHAMKKRNGKIVLLPNI